MLTSHFGVETEFTIDDDPGRVVTSLENQGLDAQREEYNHSIRSHWKVTTDSSCGYELVSPILDESNFRSIAPAMRAITDSGGYVTDSCGLHVHVELPPERRSLEEAIAVADFYHDCFELISPLITSTRRTRHQFAFFDEDKDTFLQRVDGNRYSAVNIQCLERQPTVEFRQLQGTLNSGLTVAWMTVVDAIVAHTFDGADIDRFRRHLRYDSDAEVAETLRRNGVTI